jgi:hypothetical protein
VQQETIMSWLAFQVVVGGLTLAFVGFLIGLAIWWLRSRSELKFREFEVRHRVLEKFADSESFLAFARSDEGRRLLLASPEPVRSTQRGGLRLVQVGLLVLSLGIGARIAASRIAVTTEDFERYRRENLSTWGTLFVCAGIALTASGALTRWLDRR